MEAISDDAFNVPDSTDWIGTPLLGLMQVEQAFRCHVCKDFYNSPMLTSCNHTFCSICIRRCLSVDGKCPLCRASDQISKLRGNWALREAVDAFVKSRDAILQFARKPVTATPTADLPSPKRKAVQIDDGERANAQENKRPRMSTRASKAKSAETTAAMMRDEIDVPASKDAMDFEPDDGLVACPICWSRMKESQVDKHIDKSCPGTPQPQRPTPPRPSRGNTNNDSHVPPNPTWKPSPPPAKIPERLPALNYSVLKDTALRKKMTELGLSAAGPRQMLERRHQEWITIWNANCDSARPKSRFDLMRDLEVWEKTMGTRAPTVSRAANMGAQIKDKDFDAAAWAAKHDTSFKDLIANARRSKMKADPPRPKPEPEPDSAGGEEDQRGAIIIDDAAALPPQRQSNYNPNLPEMAFVDLTEPPSSQPELPVPAAPAGGQGVVGNGVVPGQQPPSPSTFSSSSHPQ
ncbi:hypothetical protein B0T17DRAFT_484883 [Bombardia bombarda]|uniref:Postreplication repair E3 ubiquitin-protein ligase RAD18 n=1 Tax=Bombardia bombarda TaxID=252184 RepID=A0AA39XNM5_9PEZI|nr:hypothetical protein B0T17DRAFT_484883 [Bombardia bombarda]